MPSVSRGIKDVCAAALLADSGDATPRMSPLPNLDGSLAIFFSRVYAANDASTAPPPGRMPSSEPSAVPRNTAGVASLKSCFVGHRCVILFKKTSRSPSTCSKFFMISARPKTPIATATKPMPSDSSGIPKLNRAIPEFTSVPTSPSNNPSRIIAIALITEPCASTTAAIKPKVISEKYSAGPNLNASCASGGAAAANKNVATVPAKNEPNAAVAKAGPARPCRAIW